MRLNGIIFLQLIFSVHLAAAIKPPNVVVIYADDLGYGDVRCYNPDRGKIATPNIDRLAAGGMRFTDGHCSSGCCSPSRYTLLTGRYHWRSRLQSGIVGVWEPPLIAPDRLTIGKLAQQQGYKTACIGKWHLGWDWPISAEQMAHFRGLGGKAGGGGEITTEATDAHRATWAEVFSKPIAGGPTTRGFDEYFGTDVPNWPPYCFIENDRTLGIPTELLAAELLVRNQASLQGPALKDWKLEPILDALGDRAVDFIARQAKASQPFLVYMPLTAPHTPIAPTAEWRGKSGIGAYGDFVMQTDAVVGRVLAALEKSGIAENTLVLFTSDNGCASYIGVPAMEALGHFPSGPLRDYKASVYEGGHREPFIVRWPGQVKAGSVCTQYAHQADLMATLAEIWGVKLPDSAGEDSFSLLPLLKGSEQSVRPHGVNTACNGVPSLRRGPWKLILERDTAANTEVQLYNLGTDLGEKKNVAGENAALVAEMRDQLEKLIVDGRSTPGPVQKNDVRVRRYPLADGLAPKAKAPKAKAPKAKATAKQAK
jgi:arylsulfatase A-like enzyme